MHNFQVAASQRSTAIIAHKRLLWIPASRMRPVAVVMRIATDASAVPVAVWSATVKKAREQFSVKAW